MVEEYLKELETMSIHNPLRRLRIDEIIYSNEATIDPLVVEDLKESVKIKNLDALNTYICSEMLEQPYTYLIPDVLKESTQLSKMYRDLHLVTPFTFEELLSKVESTVGTEEYWNYTYYLTLLLRWNDYDEIDVELLGRLCDANNVFRRQISSLVGNVNIETLRAFGFSMDASFAEINACLLIYFLSHDDTALDGLMGRTDLKLPQHVKLVTRAVSYGSPADYTAMYYEWIRDPASLACFSEQDRQAAIRTINAEVFSKLVNEDLILKYVDLCCTQAVFAVSSGKTLADAKQELLECKNLLKEYSLYNVDYRQALDFTMRRCTEIYELRN